jgi:iron complex transport system substrate-binding protein
LNVRDGWKKWETIPAVRDGRIYIIDADIVDHASPRIVEGLEKVARIIHPDVSWK